MKTRIRYAAYSLIGVSIALTLLLAYPEANRSRAKARALAPIRSMDPRTVGIADEYGKATVTLTPAPEGLKTWSSLSRWANDRWNCKGIGINALTGIGDYLIRPEGPDPPPGQVGVGYIDHWDAGSGPLPCEEQFKAEYRGTIWFDLSEIFSKPSFPIADKATLKFKRMVTAANDKNGHKTIDKVCNDHLAAANISWWKEGRDSDTFIPEGDYIPPGFNECPYEGCSIDVKGLVNNWITGKIDRFGFVIVGEDTKYVYGLYPRDNAACETYYGDFSLTIDYRFPIKKIYVPPETYPLVCRGTNTLKVMDLDGPVGFRWVGFNFIPGTKPAGDGLLPGQCSWRDRSMRAGEPARLAQPIEGALAWIKDLNSSDSYWTFNVYNAGAQLRATGAERNKRMILPTLKTNFALAKNGGMVFPSSTLTLNSEKYVNDGELTGAGNAVWLDSTIGIFPDYLEVRFDGKKTIDEIDVITRQTDLVTPVDPKKFDPSFDKDGFGITAYDVQYWDGTGWVNLAVELDNHKVWRQFFPLFPITTEKIRIQINAGQDNAYSRVVEVEAWGK